jgi:hypothetical protein
MDVNNYSSCTKMPFKPVWERMAFMNKLIGPSKDVIKRKGLAEVLKGVVTVMSLLNRAVPLPARVLGCNSLLYVILYFLQATARKVPAAEP